MRPITRATFTIINVIPNPLYSLNRLAWDSVHFGFPVAELTPDKLPVRVLLRALQRARHEGFHLVYWKALPEQEVSDRLLNQWSGMLVDRRVTFKTDLSLAAPVRSQTGQATFKVTVFPKEAPTQDLLSLAMAAGQLSRFRRDPSISAGSFRELYETWVRRSTLRELADLVLVISDCGDRHIGMVTLILRQPNAQIGLIAVEESFRGMGLGSLLMQAARERMTLAGAASATVVTQLDNVGACKLYERHGYTSAEVRHWYHFWPLAVTQPAN